MLVKLLTVLIALLFAGSLFVVLVTRKRGSLLSCVLGLRKVFWLTLSGVLVSLISLVYQFKPQKSKPAIHHEVSAVIAPPVKYVEPPFFVNSEGKISEGEFESLVLDWFKENYMHDETVRND